MLGTKVTVDHACRHIAGTAYVCVRDLGQVAVTHSKLGCYHSTRSGLDEFQGCCGLGGC